MSVVVVTGSAGLVGSEGAVYFGDQGMDIVGIDNDMRRVFFGDEASTRANTKKLEQLLRARYTHADLDIRDDDNLQRLFARYGKAIELVLHTAAQPSHDWAAREPKTDFSVNALGTLHVLEACRQYSPDAVFVFTSTNKVYGDRPNQLPLVEQPTRWEIAPDHTYMHGIREDMPIDQSLHSLFGASKVAADILVQEYGRYFDMATACFRAGCLTGPNHAGAPLHGFLAYLMKCVVTGTKYTVFGYKGKQVRDNLHSNDLVRAFHAFAKRPQSAAVYNIGGGRTSNCSMLEAIQLCEQIAGRSLVWDYSADNRSGDHIWWISDLAKFKHDFPEWQQQYDVPMILREIHAANAERWVAEAAQ